MMLSYLQFSTAYGHQTHLHVSHRFVTADIAGNTQDAVCERETRAGTAAKTNEAP